MQSSIANLVQMDAESDQDQQMDPDLVFQEIRIKNRRSYVRYYTILYYA
jgi:hypothetical protein